MARLQPLTPAPLCPISLLCTPPVAPSQAHRIIVLRNVAYPPATATTAATNPAAAGSFFGATAPGTAPGTVTDPHQSLSQTSLSVASGAGARPKPVEFCVDEDSSCALMKEGLLRVYPLRGVIDVDGAVMLHLTFAAEAAPLVAMDKVRVLCDRGGVSA